jgi:hypothetical protein
LTSNALQYYNAFPIKKEDMGMRTTIELSDNHRGLLHFLAAQRGLRGYSKLIQEAIDLYIKQSVEEKPDIKDLLKMRGSWSEEEAKKFRKRIEGIGQRRFNKGT